MKDIKRYKEGGYGTSDMGLSDDGPRVDFEDHAAIVAALQEQRRALAAENATLRNLQPTELMVSSAHAEAEQYDNLNLDDDLIVFMWQAMHSVIKIPASEAALREIQAQGINRWIESRGGRWNGTTKEAEEYAASIRAGEQP